MCGPNTGASNTEAPLPGGSEPVASTAGSPQIEADKDVVSTTDLPSALAPNLVPPKEDPDNETPPLSHALSLERLNPEPPKTEAVNSGAPLFGGLGFISQLGLVYREAAKPRPWVSVQDAHTHAEQNLYQTLFNRGKPIAANARGLVIGVRTLARLVPMAYSNCHANLKSLVDKLAIEERPADRYNDGRLFLIYTEEEILRRRRAAGLTHVLKRTRGVSLINPLAPNTEAPVLSSAPGNPGASESESPTRRGAGKSTAL